MPRTHTTLLAGPITPLGPDRRNGRPTLDASAMLQTRILRTAFEAFVRLGIDRASMEGIAQAAQVSKRTLYLRFGSKKALLVAALRHRAVSGLEAPQAVPDGHLHDRILFVAEQLLEGALTPEAIGLEFLIREVVKSYPDIILRELTPGTHPLADQFYRLLVEDGALDCASEDSVGFLSEFLFDALVRAPRSRILHRQELCNTKEARRAYLERVLHLISTELPYFAAPRSGDGRPTREETQS